jgi:hypothetical protein
LATNQNRDSQKISWEFFCHPDPPHKVRQTAPLPHSEAPYTVITQFIANMVRSRTLSTRSATRIAARRAGMWSGWTREQKEDIRRRNDFVGEACFWAGAALTVFTGGAALPLAAIFMFPKVVDMLTKNGKSSDK